MIKAFSMLPGLFFTSFVPWYFIEQPKKIARTYVAYSNAFMEILSIAFLLRTFFSPWKSIIDEYPRNLMNYMAVLEVFTLNCTTRVIGMIFRSIALVFAITAQLVLFAFFLAYFLLWYAYPGTVMAAMFYFLGLV